VARNPLMLSCGPAVVAVTLTVNEQELLAGMVPPLKVSEVALAVGAQVPPHVVVAAGVAAAFVLLGSAPVNAAPVNGAAFGLASANVSVDTPFTAIGFGAKALLIVAGVPLLQPLNTTSSMTASEPLLVFLEW